MLLLRTLYILFFVLIFSFPKDIYSQAGIVTEEELLLLAEKHFNEEDYSEAFAKFSQLLSLRKTNNYYMYKFGVCVLYESEEKSDAIKYLLKASRDTKIESDVFFYLGKAYQYNYQFEEAIKYYKKYKRTIPDKDEDEIDMVKRAIKTCKNGELLLKYVHNLKVYDKTKMNIEYFYRAYDLENRPNDHVFKKPNNFVSKIDKKKEKYSIVYMSDTNQAIYYSSYGNKGSTGKDIYKVLRLPNNEWSLPERLHKNVNTEYDEDYPFFHADGKTLYFSSKGHNSMGGYDIFKSTYDPIKNKWSKPVNLDFPINSTADDFFYMPDDTMKYAWFASNRNSRFEEAMVYQIEVPKEAQPVTIIEGRLFLSDSTKYQQGKIKVYHAKTRRSMGTYRTTLSGVDKGKYIIILPPDKYIFSVEHKGYKTLETKVEIPANSQLTSVKQTITLGDEILVSNSYDTPDDEEYKKSIDFIQNEALLNVNAEMEIIEKKKKYVKPKKTNSNKTSNSTANSTRKNTLGSNNNSNDNNKTKNPNKEIISNNNNKDQKEFTPEGYNFLPINFKVGKFEISVNDYDNIRTLANIGMLMRLYPEITVKFVAQFDKNKSSSENLELYKKRTEFLINHINSKYLIKKNRFIIDMEKDGSTKPNELKIIFYK